MSINPFELLVGMFKAMFLLWPALFVLFLFALVAVLIRLLPELLENRALQQAGMPEIDRMTGLQFEKFLATLFRRLGYRVERTPYIGDYGADLILVKDGKRILVQAKRYSKKAVGVKAVQEAAAARPHYKCHHAMVVTNHRFSKAARELAASNNIELWDRHKLAAVIRSVDLPPQKEQANGQSTPGHTGLSNGQPSPERATPSRVATSSQAPSGTRKPRSLSRQQLAPPQMQPQSQQARSAAPAIWKGRSQEGPQRSPTTSRPRSEARHKGPTAPTVALERESPTPSARTAPTCRRCGRPMVLRQSKRGPFWGCSGFPSCRFTLPYHDG